MAATGRGPIRTLALILLFAGSIVLLPAGPSEPESAGRSLSRSPFPGGVELSYEWTDAAGTVRRIAVPVPDRELASSEQALGFTLPELRAFLIEAELEVREEEGLSAPEIARQVVSGISDPARVRVDEDLESGFNFVLRAGGPGQPAADAEIGRVLAACKERWEASRKIVSERLRRKLKAFAHAHGMEVTPRGIAVDYRAIVEANAALVKPLSDEFLRIYGSPKAGLLDAVYSFVQSIPSENEAAIEDGRYTAGLSVPLRVLVDDGGDCDSKAVLFAALWLNLSRHRMVLIRVPEHMLIGVTLPTLRGTTLTIQDRNYLLLELNCSGPARPGQVSRYSADAIDAGNYKYLIVR